MAEPRNTPEQVPTTSHTLTDPKALVYPFTFQLTDVDHLRVEINGQSVAQSLYTVTGLNEDQGQITFSRQEDIPGVAGQVMELYRDSPIERQSGYTSAGDVTAESLNRDENDQIRILQEMKRDFVSKRTTTTQKIASALVIAALTVTGTLDGLSHATESDQPVPLGQLQTLLQDDPGAALLRSELTASSGAALVGAVLNGQSKSVQERLDLITDFVSVKDFGAVGDGVTNDTAAVLNAQTQANANGQPLFFPPGNYLVLSPLATSVTLYGEPGKSTITFGEGFTNPETVETSRFFAVFNQNYSATYDADTADKFDIFGLHFHMAMENSESKTNAIVGTSNTNGVNIHNCVITSADNPATGARTCLSFYDANKHLRIYDNDLTNNNAIVDGTHGGGCIWVQGGSGTASDDSGATEDIKIFRNVCRQNRTPDADEAIALWGSQGILRDVDCYENFLILQGGGQGITTFTTASPSATFNRTENIKIRNNVIKSGLQFNAIRAGGTNLADTLKYVEIDSNYIFIDTTHTAASYGIRVTSGGEHISVTNNRVYNVGTTQVNTGINAFTPSAGVTVSENRVIGDFANGITQAAVASDNRVIGSNMGFINCLQCTDNRIEANILFRFDGPDDYTFSGNKGRTPSGAGLYVIQGTSASAGGIIMKDNEVECNNAAIRPFLLQNSGRNVVQNNTFTGQGADPAATALAVAGGNYYFTRSDDLASAPLGTNFRNMLPLGHVLRNSAPAVDANDNISFGWMLRDNSGTREWAPLFMPTVSA